ncbi:MAG: hypothetical protein LBH68_06380, partial [Bifidobacteriaceae bacterium]|nr:hypothetical protein [Bifidobacteriaceae bacterium]
AAGIDGTISTAAGVARALGEPVRVLVGDLAFLHDAGGLLRGQMETSPALDIVVLNDGGGGIFRQLEHAEAAEPAVFERFFAAPQSADLSALASAFGATYARAQTPADLAKLLQHPTPLPRILEVPLVT